MIGLVLVVIAVVSVIVSGVGDKVSKVLDSVLKDEVSVFTDEKETKKGFNLDEKRKLIDYGSVVNDLSETPLFRYENVRSSWEDLI